MRVHGQDSAEKAFGTNCNGIAQTLSTRSAVIKQELEFMDALGGSGAPDKQERIGRD